MWKDSRSYPLLPKVHKLNYIFEKSNFKMSYIPIRSIQFYLNCMCNIFSVILLYNSHNQHGSIEKKTRTNNKYRLDWIWTCFYYGFPCCSLCQINTNKNQRAIAQWLAVESIERESERNKNCRITRYPVEVLKLGLKRCNTSS